MEVTDVSCIVGWASEEIPPSIRRPWCVFEQDWEDKLGEGSSQSVEVSVETRKRLTILHRHGTLAAYAALPGELQITYAEVSLVELSEFVCWRLYAQRSGIPSPTSEFEA